MLWNEYPERLEAFTLADAYEDLQGDSPAEIPFLVWLLENPASPLHLPGSIDLFGHDCLHLLLKKGFLPADEAYIVGFAMGNDVSTKWLHLLILKFAAYFLYPPKYRIGYSELKLFDRGVRLGWRNKTKNIHKLDWSQWERKILKDVRLELALEIDD